MKLIVLLDAKKEDTKEIEDIVHDKQGIFIDADDDKCSEILEYTDIMMLIFEVAMNMKSELLVIRYSGRKNIVKYIGDDCPEMVISLSTKPNKPCSINSNLRASFENIINIF